MNEAVENGVGAVDQDHGEPEEEYGQKVQKRINKEVRRRKLAETATENAKAEAKEARERAEALEEELHKSESERVTRAKSDTQNLLQQAIEDGDTGKQAELMAEMAKAVAESREVAYQAKRKEERAKKGNGEDTSTPQPPSATPEIHEAAQAFVERNDWFSTDPEARQRAVDMEKELRDEEGYELGEELYMELESRMKSEMNEYEPEPLPQGRVSMPPVAPRSRGAGRGTRRSSSHLTEANKQTMIRYHLDPANPEHVKGYLKHRNG